MKHSENTRFLNRSLILDGIESQECRPAEAGGFYRHIGKRILDTCLVIIGLPFLAPIMLIVALLIAFGGGPVLYSQPRLGKDGRIFRLWKFRSMVVDAEDALAKHLTANADAAREWRISQKLRHDPRITPIGRFIRKTSLDELPQLINVLKGEMSLVGPRPMMPEQRGLYNGGSYEKLLPGISGLWQISERNNVTFAERARFDTEYDQKVTLGTDMMVLAKTVGVVCRGSGV